MTEEQIRRDFWHIDLHHRDRFTYVEDYFPTSNLYLDITQLDLSATRQKKLVDQWCQKLPNLNEVKYLWFGSRVNQQMFDAACQMPNLEGFWIKWSGVSSINKIKNLNKLKNLHIGSSSKIENIDILGTMKTLETLELEQLNKITDFSVVSKLTQLEGLAIKGSIWTTQVIDTLEPIRGLENLKYLVTTNSKIKDKSFDPILGLKDLVRFNCSWNYPESEFAKLKSMPNLKYGNIETSWKELQEQWKARISSANQSSQTFPSSP